LLDFSPDQNTQSNEGNYLLNEGKLNHIAKKMQVPEFTSAQLPAMFNTPHIYVRHFECMNTKLSKAIHNSSVQAKP
jgi:hypothetical protein